MDTSVFAINTRPMPGGWSWLLGDDPNRRVGLQRMLVAYALLMSMHGVRALGLLGAGQTLDDLALPVCLDGLWMITCYALVRSGRTAHRVDPTLSTLQVALALCSVVISYVLVDVGRAAAAPLVATILALTVHHLRARTIVTLGGACLALLAVCTWVLELVSTPGVSGPRPWLGLITLAVCVPGLAWAAQRTATLRRTQKAQRSALQEALTTLDALTTQDALTGLANQRHMQAVLQAECKRHARSGRPFCIALLDIDQLQAVNEQHGLAQGDEVIRQLARVGSSHLRASDMMARWSGEAFMILMPETPLDGGMRSMERLREHLRTRWGYYHEGRWVPMNCTAGLTRYRTGETLQQMLQRVEQALREARASGQDQVVNS